MYCVKKGNSHPKWHTKAVGIAAGWFLGSKNDLYQSIFSHHYTFLHPNQYLYPHHPYAAKMGKKWVQESFKHILLANCEAYLKSNNLGKNKARTELINEVALKIREAGAGLDLPGDLNAVRYVYETLNQRKY